MTKFFLMSRFSVFIISSFLHDVLHICLQFIIIVLNLREGMNVLAFFHCEKEPLGNSFPSNKAASRRASKHAPNFFRHENSTAEAVPFLLFDKYFPSDGLLLSFGSHKDLHADIRSAEKKGARCALSSFLGGAKGSRTPDLLNAIQTRYQLRYNPIDKPIIQETA